MRRRFSNEMLRMDNEMDRMLSMDSEVIGNSSELVLADGKRKELKLTFDVSQYQPEEVSVETTDGKIIVCAKHEERSAGKNIFMEYHRSCLFHAVPILVLLTYQSVKMVCWLQRYHVQLVS